MILVIDASELDFLAHIREWGKKVVFIVNGVDRRNSDEQVDRVPGEVARVAGAEGGRAVAGDHLDHPLRPASGHIDQQGEHAPPTRLQKNWRSSVSTFRTPLP